MKQEIMVDAFGRAVTAYRDNNLVSLAPLGEQDIVRFSEVLFDRASQRFYVSFREGAPAAYHGADLTHAVFTALTGRETDNLPGRLCLFDTYADAILAEQLVLSIMLNNGMMKA